MELKEIKKYAIKNGIPVINSDTENFLRLMVSIKKPENIIEVGTAVGYSTAVMLSCGNATVYSMEIDEQRYFKATENLKALGLGSRAVLHLGDAGEILPKMTGSYDMAFIDGPKGQYIYYIPYIIKLIEKGGIIICDNVLYRGLVDGKVKMRRNSLTMVNNLKKFIDYISGDNRLITQIYDIGDGISLSCKVND